MKTILNYLSQASTWKGLIFLATIVGANLNPEQQAQIVTIGMTLVGLILTFQNDKPETK